MPSLGLERKTFDGWSAYQGDSTGTSWSAPETADEFAQQVIDAICHASVTPSVGRRTFERCMRALDFGSTARVGFRHPGKAAAIDQIWREREPLFRGYVASADKLKFLAALPWVGPVTKHSLARRLGLFAEQQDRAA
jgi:hypothetical protein